MKEHVIDIYIFIEKKTKTLVLIIGSIFQYLC
jgi:hypothetical protein